MPKNRNQFTQIDWEESVRQRWLEDNSLVAGPLISWNRKINAELQEKQKQEREERKRQQLRQEREQKKLNSNESLGERTGAIPKPSDKMREKSAKLTIFKDEVIESIYAKYSHLISSTEVIIGVLRSKIDEERVAFEKNLTDGSLSS